MNWKAEFSKAGELALTSGTLMVLGWGLFVVGKELGGAAVASGKLGFWDMVAGGMMEVFLTILFLGYRRHRACAVFSAFMLNLVASACIGGMLGGFSLGYIPPLGEAASGLFIASLIWILGFLLLCLRFSRTILSPAVYVLACLPLIAFQIGMADWL